MAEQSGPSQKIDIHLGEQSKRREEQPQENYPQVPPRFIPKEGYELIGSLIKTDPILTKTLFRLLKGKELSPDDDSPTGYKEKQIPGAQAFCNPDGVEKIMNLIILHVNTPLSYREKGFTATDTAKQLSKQFILDVASNFDRWDITNPSLIPDLAGIVFQFVKTSQSQHGELPEDLLIGGALRPKVPEPSRLTKNEYRM